MLRDRRNGSRRNPRVSEIGIEMGPPQGLGTAEGDEWQRQPRMVMASFAPGLVRAYFPSLRKVLLRL